MTERFVSEVIIPVIASCDTARMAAGEPGLPRQFVWRGRTIEILAVLRSWRETGRCSHGSPELYLRKHWYEVATISDGTMRIYFDRQSRLQDGQEAGRIDLPDRDPEACFSGGRLEDLGDLHLDRRVGDRDGEFATVDRPVRRCAHRGPGRNGDIEPRMENEPSEYGMFA